MYQLRTLKCKFFFYVLAITIKHACSQPLVSDSVIKTLTVAVLEPEVTIFEGVGEVII